MRCAIPTRSSRATGASTASISASSACSTRRSTRGEEPREGGTAVAQDALVAELVDVVADDLELVPAAVAALLQGLDDLAQRQDALAEQRAIHRAHGRALVVRKLHRV